VNNTNLYILYRTVYNLLQIIGQICAFDTEIIEVPLFNTLVLRGESLNSGQRNLASRKSLYHMVM